MLSRVHKLEVEKGRSSESRKEVALERICFRDLESSQHGRFVMSTS
jgi:hypothetical protein